MNVVKDRDIPFVIGVCNELFLQNVNADLIVKVKLYFLVFFSFK